MVITARTSDGKEIQYTDGKRYLWLLALSGPFVSPASIGLYLATGSALWLLIPVLYAYVGIPLADGWLGEDTHNPPEAVVPTLARDGYYRGLLYLDVALLWASFFFSAWFVGTHPLPGWAFVVLALGAGLSSVDALTVGHELGHKPGRVPRVAAQLALALVAYGHFRVEHNRGHHADVAKGIIDTKHVIYYLSFMAFGLFLTAKSVDSERWRG